MHHPWKEELALTEAAALHTESLEATAEQEFNRVYEAAQAQGDPGPALQTDEFRNWLRARAETDEAWGRWAQLMDARPTAA